MRSVTVGTPTASTQGHTVRRLQRQARAQVYECIAPHLLDVDAALLPIPQASAPQRTETPARLMGRLRLSGLGAQMV